MSPKARHQLAREHLATARRELADESVVATIMFLHLSAEAAIVALAEHEGIDTKRRHDLKADAAHELFERGVVSDDLSETLRALNQARKDATYEGDDPEYELDDLEALLQRVDAVVVIAEQTQR